MLFKAGVTGLANKVRRKTPYEGLHTFLGLTYDALHNGAVPPVTFDDMDRTIRLTEALLDPRNRL